MTFRYISLEYMTLMADNDTELKSEMISMLIEDLATQIPKLELAIQQKDWSSIKAISHHLKSSFVFVGNEQLSTSIKRIESIAPSSVSLPNINQEIVHIKQLLPLVKEELNSALLQLK